ncbi:one cut domain family member 3-like [Schistocerca serialis cubense]|uniref:one cut domain family member 3-like n=1 Tax=Schistocerca serialis cubense TaxID=2023355 RepID=UPI00214DFFD4|nr:one cut domain family member 3-like [Schistocerca serialis cubense]
MQNGRLGPCARNPACGSAPRVGSPPCLPPFPCGGFASSHAQDNDLPPPPPPPAAVRGGSGRLSRLLICWTATHKQSFDNGAPPTTGAGGGHLGRSGVLPVVGGALPPLCGLPGANGDLDRGGGGGGGGAAHATSNGFLPPAGDPLAFDSK